jgi:hypothetical protein
LAVNTVSIVARKLKKLNLSAIQVLEILSQISQLGITLERFSGSI